MTLVQGALGMGLEGIKINKLDFDYKDPFGQPPIGLEMRSWYKPNAQHSEAGSRQYQGPLRQRDYR